MRKYIVIVLLCAVAVVLGGIALLQMNGPQDDPKDQAEQREQAEEVETPEQEIEPQNEDGGAPEEEPGASPADHIYAHRGASGKAEEHSMEAYDLAVSCGARNIEQDVVTSRDGTLFVSHDANAYRLTGVDRNYADMSDREIDKLQTHEGNNVLRLSDVFDRYGTSVNYIIELKSKDDGAVKAFQKLVDRYGYQDRIVVQCFSRDVLRALEKTYPKMPKLCLCKTQEEYRAGLEESCVDILSVEKDMMTAENCNETHQAGKQFNVWVLNTRKEIRAAIALGVDTYFTDEPKKALSLEESYGVTRRAQS